MVKPKSKYYDKINYSTQEEYDQAVSVSTTVYVGNLEKETSQDSIKELFSRAGRVKRIVMGINNEGSRCGFCFVIFENHQAAQRAVEFVSQTRLQEKIIRVDLDPGYKEGREKGRGRDGNQKRDDFRRFDNQRRYNNDRYDRGRERNRDWGDRDQDSHRDRYRSGNKPYADRYNKYE